LGKRYLKVSRFYDTESRKIDINYLVANMILTSKFREDVMGCLIVGVYPFTGN
jgi:hypothetical protein